MGSSAGAELLHFFTLPVDLLSRYVNKSWFVQRPLTGSNNLIDVALKRQKKVEINLHLQKCFQALVTRVPDIIRTIVSWTLDYLREHVINWIREQGGWVSKY